MTNVAMQPTASRTREVTPASVESKSATRGALADKAVADPDASKTFEASAST